MELFKIVYSDDSIFLGGDLKNSKWNEITKPIKQLFYNFPTQQLILYGYESYNHIILYRTLLRSGITEITHIIVMAKDNNMVHRFIYDTKLKKIYINKVLFTKELKGKSTTGWKFGEKNLLYPPTYAL